MTGSSEARTHAGAFARPSGPATSPGVVLQVSPRRIGGGAPPRPAAAIRLRCQAASARKPRLLSRLSGELWFRYAERQFLALLIQDPPRFTRFAPPGGARWVMLIQKKCAPETHGKRRVEQRRSAGRYGGRFPLRPKRRCQKIVDTTGPCA